MKLQVVGYALGWLVPRLMVTCFDDDGIRWTTNFGRGVVSESSLVARTNYVGVQLSQPLHQQESSPNSVSNKNRIG